MSSSDDDIELTISPITIQYKKEEQEQKVNHYFCDDLSEIEINQDAKIILFAGKTGAGKTTAINAFVNIVKGIKLKDKNRFILIDERKKNKKQSDSQTDGMNLYYLKDYENKPLIIIDTQGFGDTRGYKKDLELNKTFQYVFSNIINHVNIICLIVNSTEKRLDDSAKYIFNAVTALFAEDIMNNFFLIFTFTTKDQIKNPEIIETILASEDAKFLKNQSNDNKWYYNVDSMTIFDKDIHEKLNKHSFKQFLEFYNEKVRNSLPIDIKRSAELLDTKNQLIAKTKELESHFQDIIRKKKQLETIKKNIEEEEIFIKNSKNEMEDLTKDFNNLDLAGKKERIKKIRTQHEKDINELKKKKKRVGPEYERKSVNEYNYICTYCRKNCHEPCNCYWAYQSCTNFKWAGWRTKENTCKQCGHMKKYHTKCKEKYEEIYYSVPDINQKEIDEKNKRFDEIIKGLEDDIEKDVDQLDSKKGKYEEKLKLTESHEKDLKKKRRKKNKTKKI